MQTWEAIKSRRNVRTFADRPIPAEELDQILEVGRRSPSSQNWQPWTSSSSLTAGSSASWRRCGGEPGTLRGRRRPFDAVVHRGRW